MASIHVFASLFLSRAACEKGGGDACGEGYIERLCSAVI